MASRTAAAYHALVRTRVADEPALGAAVTLALCGSWDHDGPCPLAPHYTSTHTRVGDGDRDQDADTDVRIIFATEPERLDQVVGLTENALRSGALDTPNGRAEWIFVRGDRQPLRDQEVDRARRLADASSGPAGS